MTPPAPQFRRVAAAPLDASDEELIRLSDDLGVPTLVKPEAKVRPAPAPKINATPPKLTEEKISRGAGRVTAPKRQERSSDEKKSPAWSAPRTEVERFSIEIPRYIGDQVRRKAFEQRCTARFVVLQVLKEAGFDIEERDLSPDGRRYKLEE